MDNVSPIEVQWSEVHRWMLVNGCSEFILIEFIACRGALECGGSDSVGRLEMVLCFALDSTPYLSIVCFRFVDYLLVCIVDIISNNYRILILNKSLSIPLEFNVVLIPNSHSTNTLRRTSSFKQITTCFSKSSLLPPNNGQLKRYPYICSCSQPFLNRLDVSISVH